MQTGEPLHSGPSPLAATTLTPTPDDRQPEPGNLVNETTQAVTVARDGMIVQPTLHDTPQPAARFAERTMHTFPQVLLDLLKGRTHSFGNRVTMDREPAVLLRLSALVSETQKVESLGAALAASLTPFDGVPPKLDQASLLLVQLQAKLGKACVKFVQTRSRLVVVFEANHKIVCVTYDHDIAATARTPPLDPQVEDVMQIHVRKQR
ncbi:MAG: hypothetical protein R3C17_07045 [Planctomycetaceae bacterium]